MARTRVLEVLEANVGGARKHVLDLLLGLDPARFELHLACSLERDPAFGAELDALRVRGIRVWPVRMLRRPAPLSDLAALRALTRLMCEQAYRIVHTHAAKAGFLGRLAARRTGVPAIVHTPHTFPFERRDTSLAPLYRALERKAARWTDRLVLVAPSQREVAERGRIGSPEQYVVVPNGIRLPAQEPGATRRAFRYALDLREGEPAAAFVGRITPQKDVQTFLRVAGEVLRDMPQARFFIAGGADNLRYVRGLRPHISREALDALTGCRPATGAPAFWAQGLPVQVLGHRADAAELVAAFDAVLLPSLYEGLPYSLLEAMAQGVPVVASEVTGNRDAIEHGRSGFLVGVGDVGGFARHVLELLGDAALRARLGKAARRRVAAEFSQERFLRNMAELYEGLAASARQGCAQAWH